MAERHPDPAAWLVLVTGPPAAGKTSLARPLARLLGMPLVAKDDLKEVLFDRLGWGTPELSRRYSDAAYDLMFHLAQSQLAAGRPVVLEANFRPAAAEPLRRLLTRFDAQALEIHCFAAEETLRCRLEERCDRRLRHPGHCDALMRPSIPDLARSGHALALGGPLIEVDTGDPQQGTEVRELAGRVRNVVGAASPRTGSRH